ncbi:hypothetical protein [Nitrobacter sp.]|uniref:hypothetical protein n=1 Tax=Nitrobacter sp. TaxID=29420 RepID=UPI0029CAAF4A|nr:hypothetical protein [Nitrobacter sp.]
MSTDVPLDLRSTDVAVATAILFDLEESQKRLANSLDVQRQRIKELREVLDEWRTRCI